MKQISQNTNQNHHKTMYSDQINEKNHQNIENTDFKFKKIIKENIKYQLSSFEAKLNHQEFNKGSEQYVNYSKFKLLFILIISIKFSFIISLLYLQTSNQRISFNNFILICMIYALLFAVVVVQIVSANWISEYQIKQSQDKKLPIQLMIDNNEKTVSILKSNIKSLNDKKTVKIDQIDISKTDNICQNIANQLKSKNNCHKNNKSDSMNYKDIQNSVFLLNILIAVDTLTNFVLVLLCIILKDIQQDPIMSIIILQSFIFGLTLIILFLLWRLNIKIRLFLQIKKEQNKKIQLDADDLKSKSNQQKKKITTYKSMQTSMIFIETQSMKYRNKQIFTFQEDKNQKISQKYPETSIMNFQQKKPALKSLKKIQNKISRNKIDQIEQNKKVVEINFNKIQKFNYSRKDLSQPQSQLSPKQQKSNIYMVQSTQKSAIYKKKQSMILKEKHEQQLIKKLRQQRIIQQSKLFINKNQCTKTPTENAVNEFSQLLY